VGGEEVEEGAQAEARTAGEGGVHSVGGEEGAGAAVEGGGGGAGAGVEAGGRGGGVHPIAA